jgi:hypothetical protein
MTNGHIVLAIVAFLYVFSIAITLKVPRILEPQSKVSYAPSTISKIIFVMMYICYIFQRIVTFDYRQWYTKISWMKYLSNGGFCLLSKMTFRHYGRCEAFWMVFQLQKTIEYLTSKIPLSLATEVSIYYYPESNLICPFSDLLVFSWSITTYI